MSDSSAREETAMSAISADSSMRQDIFSNIDELITATKEKSSASEADRRKFEHAWLEIANKEGLSEEVILRLFRGFTIDASRPFYLYAQKTNAEETYQNLLTSKLFMENEAGSSFKLILDLLGLEISKPTGSSSLASLCRSLPSVAYNKDGNLYGFAGQSIHKYLVKRLANQVCPGLELDLKLSPEEVARLASILNGPLKSLGMKSNIRSSERDAVISLMKWVQNLCSGSEAASAGCGEATPQASESLTGVQRQADGQESATRTMQMVPLQDGNLYEGHNSEDGSMALLDAHSLDSVISFLHSYGEEHERLKNEASMLRQQLEAEKNTYEHNEADVMSLRVQLAEAKERVAELEAAVSALTTEKDELGRQIVGLKEDSASAREMLSLMNRDHERQSNEQLKRLSSELRIEYQDFKDAEELPMDADLGENMRLQIQSIFKILRKHGLEF